MTQKILITGAAGFIGFHTTVSLIKKGYEVVGIDNLNDYYDVELKNSRIKSVEKFVDDKSKWQFIKCDLVDYDNLIEIFNTKKPDVVINLAAQAGVRYSLENPKSYINSNLVGFGNILECCRLNKISHLIYASSSSVYGNNKEIPFSEKHSVNHPLSLYAATKRSNELMAHTYSHLYGLPTTGLRFFTVYGPWGRPDMSYFIFTSKIVKGEEIKIYNNGDMSRDFTYIDDVVYGIIQLLNKTPSFNNFSKNISFSTDNSWAPFNLFNIGNSNPISLLKFIETIEKNLGMKAKKIYLPMQPGDVKKTYANIEALNKFINFKPKTSLDFGIKKFVSWYLNFYK